MKQQTTKKQELLGKVKAFCPIAANFGFSTKIALAASARNPLSLSEVGICFWLDWKIRLPAVT